MKNRKILLGVTGSIAAWKAAELARLLIKAGAQVKVVMTDGGAEFISPMTFQALTGDTVRTALFDPAHEAAMGHIELARWADQVLIAPASANAIARLAHGLADDLLTTLCLATPAPVAVAPAMNQQMWRHAATQHNVELLQSRGCSLLGPDEGEQACGDVGPGRMLEPQAILEALDAASSEGVLSGKQVLITAGPTREPIDPVRYLSNRSSGKMGFAIAEAAVSAGAEVTLVSGPVALIHHQLVNRINVETAGQMHTSVIEHIQGVDVFIACAAVSDYRPAQPETRKIKKSQTSLNLSLTRNPDILADVSTQNPDIFCVGFAAETNDLESYALGKLEAKQLDMIAANPVNDGQGFEVDDNQLEVFWPGGRRSLPKTSKQQLAQDLVQLIAERLER